MYPSKASREYGEAWEGQYQRNVTKRASNGDNFRLDRTGDLVMIAPLTKHADQRCSQRGIARKTALKSAGIKSSQSVNAVVVTAIDPGKRQRKPIHVPAEKDLPSGHIIQSIAAPATSIGCIIGSKGRNIKSLTQTHNVCIEFERLDGSSSEQIVHVYGPKNGVEKTMENIKETIKDVQRMEEKRVARGVPSIQDLSSDETIVSIRVPEQICDKVLGRGRRNINSITSKCNVKYKIEIDNNTNTKSRRHSDKIEIVIWGEILAVDDARQRIERVIDLVENNNTTNSDCAATPTKNINKKNKKNHENKNSQTKKSSQQKHKK